MFASKEHIQLPSVIFCTFLAWVGSFPSTELEPLLQSREWPGASGGPRGGNPGRSSFIGTKRERSFQKPGLVNSNESSSQGVTVWTQIRRLQFGSGEVTGDLWEKRWGRSQLQRDGDRDRAWAGAGESSRSRQLLFWETWPDWTVCWRREKIFWFFKDMKLWAGLRGETYFKSHDYRIWEEGSWGWNGSQEPGILIPTSLLNLFFPATSVPLHLPTSLPGAPFPCLPGSLLFIF